MYGGVGRGPGGDVRRYRHLKMWRRLATYVPHPNPPRTSRPLFFPHVSEGSQCFCFLLRKEGSSSELLASLTPAVLPLTERNKSNACVFFLRVHVNGGRGRRALIKAERILVSSMQSSFSFALISGSVFFATAGHLLLFGFCSVGTEDSHTLRCSSSFLPHAGAYPSLTQGVSVVRTRTLGHNIALLAVWKRTRTSENVGRTSDNISH